MTRVATALLCSTLLLFEGAVWAQDQEPVRASEAPSGPPAAATEKVRVFTGHWQNEKPMVGLTKPGVVPFRPEYEAKLAQIAKLAVAGDTVPGNEPSCIPNGPAMDMAFGMQIFSDATQMVVLSGGPRVRYIWLDGRKHTPDELLFESFAGESVAHWEGDTLVVDTVGLNPGNEIVFGIASNDTRVHMIERWRMTSPRTLQIETTIKSDKALTRPWVYVRTYSRQPPSTELQYCVPAMDRARGGGFDLTPPEGGYVPPGAER